ncbi:MAG: TIGR03085 family metal-binding protein [Ornithinibacter sp.]
MTSTEHLPVARLEREALCDTFLALGPDAPTLCDPWLTRDLAAHLVVRERRPDLAAGLLIPALAPRLERGQAQVAQGDWHELVDEVRSGPPIWSPTRISKIDALFNTVEMVIHHEDALRGDGAVGPRREVHERTARAVLSSLRSSAKLMFRRSDVGVRLVAPGAEPITAGPAGRVVTVSGAPIELLLVGSGRLRVAEVELEGAPEDIEALRTASLGLA